MASKGGGLFALIRIRTQAVGIVGQEMNDVVRLRSFLLLLLGGLFLGGAAGTQAQTFMPFGGAKANLQNVRPPKGCNLQILDHGKLMRYTAPAKNFEEPIHIEYSQEAGQPKRPDVLVWADEIRWHNDIQTATASGRIVVDDQAEYRVETTYVEYNHIKGQIFCPRKTKIIQKTPEGYANEMLAESAVLDFDQTGIKSAKFDRVLSMNVVLPRDQMSKSKGGAAKTSPDDTAPKTKKKDPSAEKMVSMEQGKGSAPISGPAE
jgi:hypothetical protein